MPRVAKDRNYFNETVENAVISYIQSTDNEEKNYLWSANIENPLRKMTTIILKKYRLYEGVQGFDETVDKCYIFAFDNITKYRPYILLYKEKGSEKWLHHKKFRFFNKEDGKSLLDKILNNEITFSETIKENSLLNSEYDFTLRKYKAYSYLGTIIRNHYKKLSKEAYQNDSISDVITELDLDTIEDKIVLNEHYELVAKETNSLVDKFIDRFEELIRHKIDNTNTLKEHEIKVGEALLIIFRNFDRIFGPDTVENVNKKGKVKIKYVNVFDKRNVNLQLKEITGLKSKDITAAIAYYKEIFESVKKNILNEEYF